MKPLIVLVVVFAIAALAIRVVTPNWDLPLAARIGMCAMLCFTAIGHFAFVKGMSMMVPEFLPFKKEIVYSTGILEIVLGIGLLIADFKILSAWILIALFVLMLPANINAAKNKIDYQKGTYEGPGQRYLWFRIPLQLFFIAWVAIAALIY